VGAWKTMFAWHKEDLDLSAINFHHYGKTKYSHFLFERFWYALKKSDDHYLQDFAKD
jgi:jumonji domain-containing protein 2